ncbi:MAG: hypothetical protein ACPGJS_15855 [Flammeovirgaceae bacterium]
MKNRIISERTARTLQENWVANVNSSDDLHNSFIFNKDGIKKAAGFMMAQEKFIDIISPIGAYQLCVRFGHYLKEKDQSTISFCCILYSTDRQNRVVSDYWLISSPIYYKDGIEYCKDGIKTEIINGQSAILRGVIPSQLARIWLEKWYCEIKNPPLSSSLFVLPSNKGVLQGFTIDIKNLLLALYPISESYNRNIKNIYILFTNHETGHSNTLENNLHFQDTFGVLFSSSENPENDSPPTIPPIQTLSSVFTTIKDDESDESIDSNEYAVSTFFNMTAPCPDTCP